MRCAFAGRMLPLALAGGCALARPLPAEYDYYVLSPLAAAPASERVPVAGEGRARASERVPAAGEERAAAARVPVLVVGRVTIPDYLDRESMATRLPEHRLVYSKRERWAEPLEDGLARTLRQNLASVLWPDVLVQPRRIGAAPDYDVEIDVVRFEQLGSREVELWVRFTLHAGGEIVHAGEVHFFEPVEGEGAGVATAALSRALARLSREMADIVLAFVPRANGAPRSSGAGR